MLRSIAIFCLLLAGPTAEAAFGGKIKNIRVRERNSGAGYRVVVIVKDDCDGAACDWDGGWEETTPELTLTPTDGGPDLGEPQASDWRRETRFFRSFDSGIYTSDAISVDSGIGIQVSPGIDGMWDEASNDVYTLAARQVEDADGTTQIEVRLQGVDKSTSLQEFSEITLSNADGTAITEDGAESIALPFTSAKAKAVFELDTEEDLSAWAYDLALALDHAGEEADSRTGDLGLDAAPGNGLYRMQIRSRNDSTTVLTRMITESDTQNADQTLSVVLKGADSDTVVTDVLHDAPIAREAQFDFEPVGFDDVPVGPYSVTLTMRDADGGTVGEPVSVSYEHVGEDGATSAHFDWSGASQALVVDTTGSEISGHVSLTGEKATAVHSVEMQFEEPFEGPSPQENPIELSFAREFQKWVFKDPATGVEEDFSATIELFNADGESVDDVGLTTGMGSTVNRNGFGNGHTLLRGQAGSSDLL